MSFSRDVRNEIARINPDKSCCKKAELYAFLILTGEIIKNEGRQLKILVSAENPATARKIYKLLKDCYQLRPSVAVREGKRFKKFRIYVIDTGINSADDLILQELDLLDNDLRIKRHINRSLTSRSCCRRAFLRGVFICKGFINRPEGNYHLELVLNDSRLAHDIQKILFKLGLEARMTERKTNLLLYIKGSEEISDFLRIIGASKALLDFENVRIIKHMRNNVNRQVNCETANLAKTVNASLRQVELFERLIQKVGIDGLPRNLRDIALLRIDYPDNSLKELGQMLDTPLSKSGVAYRMRKLESYAREKLEE